MKTVIFHCRSTIGVTPTVPIDITDQANRDLVEMLVTDFFNANNIVHITVQFVDPPRRQRVILRTVVEAREFLRNWQTV